MGVRSSKRRRFGEVRSLGLDEVLFVKLGDRHHQHFSTSIVDVERGQLLDVVPGRSAVEPVAWLARQGEEWRGQVRFATLDLLGTYKSVFDAMVPDATQVADPFHVVRHANDQLDKCRRRVQNETMGHRGRKDDPLYRSRRLLTKADERLDDKGREKLLASRQAIQEVRSAWPGTPRRPCDPSMSTSTSRPHSSSPSGSATTCRTSRVLSRCDRSGAPCSSGSARSAPGTVRRCQTGRRRPPTT
jgi:transposase